MSQSGKGLMNNATVNVVTNTANIVVDRILSFFILEARLGSSSTIGKSKIEVKTPTIKPPICPQLSTNGVMKPKISPDTI